MKYYMCLEQIEVLKGIENAISTPRCYDWWILAIAVANVLVFTILTAYIAKLNKKVSKNQDDLQKRNLKLQLYDKRVVVYYNLVNTYLKLARKIEEKKYDDTKDGIILRKLDQIELIYDEFISQVYIDELTGLCRIVFKHELISQSIFEENICKDIKTAKKQLKNIIDKLTEINNFFSYQEDESEGDVMYKMYVQTLANKRGENRLEIYKKDFSDDKFIKLYFEFYDLREEYLTHLNKSLLSEIMKCINISNIDK